MLKSQLQKAQSKEQEVSNLHSLKGFITHTSTLTMGLCFRIIFFFFLMQIAKINWRNTSRFSRLTRCNAPCYHSILYCTKLTCARHPENVHREREKTYRYKHSPNHCLSSTLYLAQMQNQHRWRADANSDQLKQSDLGYGSLQWNTTGPAKPHWAAMCAIFLCSFNVCSYILVILVWKANLKGWHKFI